MFVDTKEHLDSLFEIPKDISKKDLIENDEKKYVIETDIVTNEVSAKDITIKMHVNGLKSISQKKAVS